MKEVKMKRSQPRLDKAREPLPSCVKKSIMDEVNRQSRKFGVSRSWLIAEALADTFGIELEDYERYEKQTKSVIKMRRVL